MKKGKDPDPYLWLMDPDRGGKKICWSGPDPQHWYWEGGIKRCPAPFFYSWLYFTEMYFPFNRNFELHQCSWISSCLWMGYTFSFQLAYFAEGKKVAKVYLSSSILQLLKLSKVANNNKTMVIQYKTAFSENVQRIHCLLASWRSLTKRAGSAKCHGSGTLRFMKMTVKLPPL
jgi:hypothetical protein